MIAVAFDMRDPDRSGLGRVTRSLAHAFTRHAARSGGFRVTLCGPPDALHAMQAPDGNAPLVPWTGHRHSLRAQREWSRVRRATGPAIWCFTHWDVPWHALPERYVVFVHDLILLRVPGATSLPRRLLAQAWIGRAVRHASRVAVVSEFTGRDLAARFPAAAPRIRVVPNGVDAANFREPTLLTGPAAPFAARGPFMVSVGNRKRHKNLLMGVEVLSRVAGLQWIVVGQWFPEWEDVMAQARQRGVDNRMLVLDAQPDDVLRALYQRAACLFFPSRYEGFGLPLLEALAAGAPVVASDAASIPEVVGPNAELCAPDDAAAFAAAVSRAVASGRSDGTERVAWARAFSWDSSAARLAAVLEEVACD